MVDLPHVPRRLVTSETPKSSLSAADIAAPYNSMAKAMDQGGQALTDIAVHYAERAGYEAVTIDEDGLPRVASAPIVGKAGEALDRAVKIAAVAKGDARADRDLLELRQKHQNDPANFIKAADEYRDRMVSTYREVAGPAAALAIEKSINSTTKGIYGSLLNQHQSITTHEAFDDISTRIATLQNKAFALIASGGDVNTGELKEIISNYHALQNELSGNPLFGVSPSRAEYNVKEFNSGLQVARKNYLVLGKGGVYETKGPDAALTEAQTIRTDASLNLTPTQREHAASRLESDISKRMRGEDYNARHGLTELTRATDSFVKREAEGLTPSAGEWDRIVEVSRDIPGGDAVVAQAAAKRTLLAQLTTGSADRADNVMKTLREQYRAGGGIDPAQAELIRFGEKYVAEERRLMASDMLGYALKQRRIMEIAPVDFEGFAGSKDPGAAAVLASQIGARTAQAQALGASLERRPQYFRPEERARLKDMFDAGGDQALSLAGAIVRGGGENSVALLRELGDDAPKLAQAGVLLNSGGSLEAARDIAQFNTLNAKDMPKVDATTQLSGDARVVGQAYLGAPGDGVRVKAAAEAITRVRMNRQGLDPKADPKTEATIYERALIDASGGVFVEGQQYGGLAAYSTGWFGNKAQVVAPTGVRADKFRDLVTSITNDDLKTLPNPPMKPDGTPYTARDLTDKIPIKVAGGYRFASKNYVAGGEMRFVVDASGQPWTLPWDAIEPALRQRVPAAFIGAR